MRKLLVSRVACIIPVVGSTEGLENTLLSVLERRPDHCEVIVASSVPYDDPYKLQGEIQILAAPPRAGLVDCVNLGVRSTAAPIVHVLARGGQATEGWIDRALERFENPRVAAVVPFVHDAEQPRRLLCSGVSYLGHGRKGICRDADACEQILGPQLSAAFYRKSVIDALGGIPTSVGDTLADVDLAIILRKAGWQIEVEPACRVLAQRIDDGSPGAFRSALARERLYWRHFAGNGIAGLLVHPFVLLADIVRTKPWWKLPASAIGRLTGLLEFGQSRDSEQAVAAAAEVIGPTQVEEAGERAVQRIDAAHRISDGPQKRQHLYKTPGTSR